MAGPASSAEALQLSVAFKGAAHSLVLPPGATLADLGAALAAECSVAPATIKLLGGKAGMVKPAERPERTVAEAGIVPGARLKMLASSAPEVAAVQAARDLPGLAPLDHELRRDLARAAGGPREPPPVDSPYTFERFEAWQHPGIQPPPSEAVKLLRRLAADAGIVGVMRRHRWRVPLLSELPPEGYVGVSPVCILGLNHNRGEHIQLRLRTDDLRGFRRYDSIRETLLHELTHNVHGPHDAAFKALLAQLRREAAELDWRGAPSARAAAALEGPVFGGTLRYDELAPAPGVMAQTTQLSGRPLRELAGGAAAPATAPAADPKAAAAAAAAARAQQVAGGAEPRHQQPVHQPMQWRERPLRKGEAAWYRQRDGSWVPAVVVHVEHAVQPPSYGITFDLGDAAEGAAAGSGADGGSSGAKGSYRETEGSRLLPRGPGAPAPPGALWPGGEVEGLGHRDAATEAKEDEVRRLLEE